MTWEARSRPNSSAESPNSPPIISELCSPSVGAALLPFMEFTPSIRKPGLGYLRLPASGWSISTAPAIRDLAEQYGFTPIQIVCTADVEVVAARYRSRFENNERHPGHQDKRLSDDFDAEAVAKLFKPLDIGGHMLNVDSTEFTDQDFESLVKSVENVLN